MPWQLTGNSRTNPPTDFLGTKDEKPLAIKTHNTERMRITLDGKIGINTTEPKAQLEVHSSGKDNGVHGESTEGNGISGRSDSNQGVFGYSKDEAGVYGQSESKAGVHGESVDGEGVLGRSSYNHAIYGHSNTSFGVYGESESNRGVVGSGSNYGVSGHSNTGIGVWGTSKSNTGVFGESDSSIGVLGISSSNQGVSGHSDSSVGVVGTNGVSGYPTDVLVPAGVYGQSDSSVGVVGINGVAGNIGDPLKVSAGVHGASDGSEVGVYGTSKTGNGVQGVTWGKRAGVLGQGWAEGAVGICGMSEVGARAGEFYGDVLITGSLTKAGGGFKIDHPRDPANKYLSHSFVESPDMLNVYNGNVTTDANGDAAVRLPDYFEALNQDFRYQLTVIGQFAQAIVAGEISNNQFTIKTDKPNIKVSWQVTGSRKDAWAQANPLVIEQEKSALERDHYLHPEVYGYSQEQSIARVHHAEVQRRAVEEQQKTRED